MTEFDQNEGSLWLTYRDVAQVVNNLGHDRVMDGLTACLDAAFCDASDEWDLSEREGFHYQEPKLGLLEWMPVMRRGERVLLKLVGYHPSNPKDNGIATIQSLMAFFSIRSGVIESVLDGELVTAMRTGAASAVATRLLASPRSDTLGIIGAGAQAVTQVHALGRVLPLREVLVHDIDPETETSLADRLHPILRDGVRVRVVDLRCLLEGSDVLSVATSVAPGEGPVFNETQGLKSGLHINAVGSDFEGKTEIPIEVLRQAYVSPDFLSQAVREGECQQLEAHEIGQTLPELCRSGKQTEHLRDRLTVFDSTGFALEDYVAAEWVVEQAKVLGIGNRVRFSRAGGDPKDPYACTEFGQVVTSSAGGSRGSRSSSIELVP